MNLIYKMGKNIKFYTKLVIGFIVIFLTMLVSLYCGYTSAATIVTLEPAAQEEYLSNYAYFTAILFVIVVTVIAGIAFVSYIVAGLLVKFGGLTAGVAMWATALALFIVIVMMVLVVMMNLAK